MRYMGHIVILGQEGGGGGGGGGNWMFAMLLAVVVFYVFLLSGHRRDRKKRQQMLASISKNDRVMTIGGIIGSVFTVNENEVTLKVDESANVKVTVVRGAIQKVLREDEKPTEVQ